MAFRKFKTPKQEDYCIQIIPFASDTKHRVKLMDGDINTIMGILCDENQVEKVVADYHKKAVEYFRLQETFNKTLTNSK